PCTSTEFRWTMSYATRPSRSRTGFTWCQRDDSWSAMWSLVDHDHLSFPWRSTSWTSPSTTVASDGSSGLSGLRSTWSRGTYEMRITWWFGSTWSSWWSVSVPTVWYLRIREPSSACSSKLSLSIANGVPWYGNHAIPPSGSS